MYANIAIYVALSSTIGCYHTGNVLFHCVKGKLILTNADCVTNTHEYLNQLNA